MIPRHRGRDYSRSRRRSYDEASGKQSDIITAALSSAQSVAVMLRAQPTPPIG